MSRGSQGSPFFTGKRGAFGERMLEMKDISKSFSDNKVLNGVQLSVEAGEVHALLGENGAGKSTLMKILGGIYSKDSGRNFY